ncbi:MAG TPA: hypothetical protein VF783_18415, partial [Terriglobales bacterium]
MLWNSSFRWDYTIRAGSWNQVRGLVRVQPDSTTKILAANPSVRPNLANQFGKLLKSSQSGQWKVDANVGDFDYQ